MTNQQPEHIQPDTDSGKGILPLGIQTFSKVRGSGDYYVDKTAYAHRMAVEGEYYFLSRPRRFGKSLFVSMLKELFEGNEQLFHGLYVHDKWDWSVSRPVVKLSFGRGDFTDTDAVMISANAQLDAVQRRTGVVSECPSAVERLAHILEELHRRSGRRVVVLVDEYDKPILEALDAPDAARANRDFLRGFYAVLKDADEHLRFTFLTGVGEFSKVSLLSGLDNLEDITLDPRYSSVCGFTEGDLERVFSAELEGLDRDRVREWYNGYSWLGSERVYNPHGLLKLLRTREFRSHWFETYSPRFLGDTLMERGVPTMSLVQSVDRDELLLSSDVDSINTEPLLFQTGYLTITDDYDDDGDVTYQVDYPNRDVRQSLHKILLKELVGSTAAQAEDRTQLRDLLRTGDTRGLRWLFEEFFTSIPHQWHTNSRADEYEAYHTSVFYTYFAACGLDVRVEDATSRGRVDMTVVTPQRIWLFEFKTTTTDPPGAAIQQIYDRGYTDKYHSLELPILLVEVELDTETRGIANYQTATIPPNAL